MHSNKEIRDCLEEVTEREEAPLQRLFRAGYQYQMLPDLT
jgi:hypothetical protein